MTDIHTHILPRMDDGAKSSDMSLEMLKLERDMGVDRVFLTSHFYPYEESLDSYIARRDAAYARLEQRLAELPEEERAGFPVMIRGAEVAWYPGIEERSDLERLTLGDSGAILVEMPYFMDWYSGMFGSLFLIKERTGLEVILAHPERFYHYQKSVFVEELLVLGLPEQISSASLTGDRRTAKRALAQIREGKVDYIASDCHNTTSRRPDLPEAYKVIEDKLGSRTAEKLKAKADALWKQAAGSLD